MLRKDREMVMKDIEARLKSSINTLASLHNSWYSTTDGVHYPPSYSTDKFAAPSSAVGWPPDLQEYIRRVTLIMACAIVDAIYTEGELDARVDEILLSDGNAPKS